MAGVIGHRPHTLHNEGRDRTMYYHKRRDAEHRRRGVNLSRHRSKERKAAQRQAGILSNRHIAVVGITVFPPWVERISEAVGLVT